MYKLDSQRQMEEKKTLEMSEMKYLGVVGKQPSSREGKMNNNQKESGAPPTTKLLSATFSSASTLSY